MTAPARITLGIGGVLFVAISVLLALQQQRWGVLRESWREAQAEARERAALEADNRRLREGRFSDENLSALRADHEALGEFRRELEELKNQSRPPRPTSTSASPAAEKPPVVLATEWHNAGRDSPRATFETAMWAATNGEPVALASCLELSPEARTKAESLFRGLGEETRAKYGSPETLVALLTTRAIDAKAMSFQAESGDDQQSTLTVILQQGESRNLKSNFKFHRAEEGWHLIVPGGAVDSYRIALKASDISGKP